MMEPVKPTSYRELEIHVLRWAEERKIIPRSTPAAQATKTVEESAELLVAAAELRMLKKVFEALEYPYPDSRDMLLELRAKARKDFKDAVGDTVVTLINACALADVDLVQCLGQAYEEIRDRKGTLGEDDIFRKEV